MLRFVTILQDGKKLGHSFFLICSLPRRKGEPGSPLLRLQANDFRSFGKIHCPPLLAVAGSVA